MERWMPIVALAQAAIARDRHDIAREVFAAADRPGLQRDHLRERCIELTTLFPAIHSRPGRPATALVRLAARAKAWIVGARFIARRESVATSALAKTP
jgi:hypothetical protein